jgi:transmembrane sensor
MDYAHYDISDFATDDFFIQWVVDQSPEASRFWEEYKKNNPAQRDKIEKAYAFVADLRKSEQTLHAQAKVRKMWQHIEDGVSGNRPFQQNQKLPFSVLKVAACISILCLIMAAWYVLKPSAGFTIGKTFRLASEYEGFIDEVNTTGEVIRIHLSDGSIVDLHDNSRLRYRRNHAGYPCREAYLTGEAFFDVANNPKQPFLVYTGEVVTKVLGTSFRVKAFDDDQDILVAVKTGKVSVYSSRQKKQTLDSIVSQVNGVVLSPNQQVVYARTDDSFIKTIISDPEILHNSEVQPRFVFENTPVTEVFDVLQKVYGVEIIVNKEVMSNCFLTVHFANEPLFEKLKIVCRTIGAKYELIDAKIIVTGNGC